jgi:2-beta-glucuronyltransferase
LHPEKRDDDRRQAYDHSPESRQSTAQHLAGTYRWIEDDLKRIAFITGHYYRSNRRGGIHWLAKTFHRAGWNVLFFTSGLSWISRLYGDHRFQFPVVKEANRVLRIEKGFASFVWFTPWHPVDLRSSLANRLARSWFRHYADLPLHDAKDALAQTDVIVIESGSGLMLMKRLKRLNPSACFIYRLSDKLEIMKASPLIMEAEQRWAPEFDLITAPSMPLLDRYRHLQNTAIHPQGLDKDLFDSSQKNPYNDSSGPNLISIGNMIYDLDFLERASNMFPDWRFHIIGWLKNIPQKPNIFFYGEKAFEDAIAYMKFADIGLSPYQSMAGNEYLAQSSHKMLQYTYCRLPVVAPYSVADPSRPHIIGYTPGDNDSIRQALEKAIRIDRNTIDRSAILSWDEIVTDLAKDLGRIRNPVDPCERIQAY